jgi:TolB-like protein/Tfp pilus assembly protein PilF
VAEAEGHRDPERASDHGGGAHRSLAPGALTALLAELAHVSEVAVAPVPLPGTVVSGRFELVREIGAGGFGVVYEARDRELHRSVAFKLVRPGRLEAGSDQLGREAEVVAQLSHPNLVTLFDVGRCDFGPYLVLELLRGATLEDRLREGPIPAAETVRIAAEIAKGLRHAHAQGVVHRDLKPSNVFRCADGQVKVLDFGMSHAFGRRRVEGGTPEYMAPEQWRGAPEDERTDVYALGVMLYEMLTGELPFKASADGRAAMSARKAPPLELPGASGLAALVARMLEDDPTKRPRNGAEVLATLSALAADVGRAPEATARPVRRARSSRVAAGVVAAGAVLAVGAWAVRGSLLDTPAPARARAIAVLPFENVSDSADNEYFSDGLTEEILHTLTRLRELKVAARTSSFSFKDRKVPIVDVAKRLRVDVVLDGSVRRSRDSVRIAVELIDGRSGFQMWAQTYERRLEDVFAIQDDIAHQVVGALELVLSRASKGEFRRPHAASIAAYDAYLRGRAQLRLPVSRESLDRAAALFGAALAADPAFAQAHAGLCEAWLARYEGLGRAAESFAQAEAACATALSRDPDAGDVYVALGNLHLASGRYDQAEREFRQASTLPSSTVDALLGLAQALAVQRRTEEAERTFAQAASLDPGDWRVHKLRGHFYLRAGRHAEAARSYAEEVACTPDDPRAHNNLGAAYFEGGDLAKAAEAWRTSLALQPTASVYSNVATSSYYLGRLPDAVAMYEKAVALAPEDHRIRGNLADAYAHVGGRDADATEAYRKAAALAAERLRINPADAGATSDLAHYEARLGRADDARRLVADALKRDPKSQNVHYNAALVSARLGANQAALAEIEQAVALGYPRHLLPKDPGLEAIRHEPRFATLLPPRDK